MSEVYGFITDIELINTACGAISSSCQEYCLISEDCNCDQIIDLLKERFLNV